VLGSKSASVAAAEGLPLLPASTVAQAALKVITNDTLSGECVRVTATRGIDVARFGPRPTKAKL
jgi:hypothetical protein